MNHQMIMANEDGFSRNFRSTYYEKVGFCGIEEKKILDVLIASSPLDTEKLSDFCARFDLARRREEVWKLLLGVEFNLKDPSGNLDRIARIREEHFDDLKRSLCILLGKGDYEFENFSNFHSKFGAIQTGTSNTFKSNPSLSVGRNNELPHKDGDLDNGNVSPLSSDHDNHIANRSREHLGKFLTLMYLLESGQLKLNTTEQLESTNKRVMVSMAAIFVNMTSDLKSAFFLFRNFCFKLSEQQSLLKSHYEKSLTHLSQDMPKLDRHIRSICNFDELPCWYWFRYCFFDILDEKSLLRLWDRIIGGCIKCIQKVMKAILTILEPFLLASQCQEDVVKILTKPLKREESENLIISVCDK